MFVVPEIERRVAAGTLFAAVLPFQVAQFRWIQGDCKNTIEINDEVNLLVKVKVMRPVAKGESPTLTDIDPDECYLEGPVVDGKPAAFFLCRSTFLNFMTIFDFTPNLPPDYSSEPSELRAIRYPIAELTHAESALATMRPLEKYRLLCDADWPPGPAYYPNVLWHVHANPGSLGQPNFADTIAVAYGQKYLEERLDFWKETEFFGDRLVYVKKAIDEYLAEDYISSIYVLVPQFEGIIKDYLTVTAGQHRYRLESCVADLKALVLSRRALMFPRQVLDIIFTFIGNGPFLANTTDIHDPAIQLTRHGIAHGQFIGFESRDIALKYVVLLDALAYVILHDKILAGTL